MMELDVTPVSDGALKPSVYAPTVPEMPSPEKTARPVASVVAVAVPDRLPEPLAIAAVTTVPACKTGLPCASRTRIAGCVVNGDPLAAPAGCVLIVSCDAAPALMVIPVDEVLVTPLALKASE